MKILVTGIDRRGVPTITTDFNFYSIRFEQSLKEKRVKHGKGNVVRSDIVAIVGAAKEKDVFDSARECFSNITGEYVRFYIGMSLSELYEKVHQAEEEGKGFVDLREESSPQAIFKPE